MVMNILERFLTDFGFVRFMAPMDNRGRSSQDCFTVVTLPDSLYAFSRDTTIFKRAHRLADTTQGYYEPWTGRHTPCLPWQVCSACRAPGVEGRTTWCPDLENQPVTNSPHLVLDTPQNDALRL
jgi:hypothetical protein